jgi:hypothetical protein
MENFLTILLITLLITASILMIISQITEMINSHKFYKRMKKDHEELMNRLKGDVDNGTELEETK